MTIFVKKTYLFIILFTCFSLSIFAERKNTLFLEDTTYQIKKVVIDAGHGGKDSGCLGKKSQEKNITLKIALALGRKIKAAFPSIDIIYTRADDRFIPLSDRASIANRNKADVFISIHCNFVPAASAHHGSETYVLGLNRSKENLEIAKRENAAIIFEDDYKKRYKDVDFSSPEADILITAVQSSYMERSVKLASLVEKNLKSEAERKSHGVKQAGFLVLRETSMPSILVETGFLSNREEEIFLLSSEGQDQEAQAIFNAFATYKEGVETGKEYDVIPYGVKPISNKKIEIPKNDDTNILLLKETQKNTKVIKKAIEPKNEKNNQVVTEVVIASKPPAVIFKVQLVKSPTKLKIIDEKWKLVKELEVAEEEKQYIYRADGFETYENAAQTCQKLKEAGFKDAFIVAYDGKKRILNMSDAIKKSQKNK